MTLEHMSVEIRDQSEAKRWLLERNGVKRQGQVLNKFLIKEHKDVSPKKDAQ